MRSTAFSRSPLLIFTIAIGESFLDVGEVCTYLVEEVRQAVGDDGAKAVETMLAKRKPAEGSRLATILGLGTLLFGRLGSVRRIAGRQRHLASATEAERRSGRWCRYRFLSFCLVIGTGFLMLTSMIISTFVATANTFVSDSWPKIEPLGHWLTMGLSFVVATLLFAMIFKLLPDAKVP